MSTRTTLLTITLALGCGSAALAQPPGQVRRDERAARQRFLQMDTNRDGVISRNEWRGSLESFRVHDWNRDGVLSGQELTEAARVDGNGELPDYDDSPADWSAARFQTLDRNHDGRLTIAEWVYDDDSFRRADRNRDNVLSRTEFVGGDFDDDRGDRFDYLDLDGNNRITRDEWHASEQAFTWLDRNRDGVLSRIEVEGQSPTTPRNGPGGRDAFSRLDVNHDNRISRSEWQWNRGSFDQRDLNDDGMLSRREFDANGGSSGWYDSANESDTVTVGGTSRWVDTGIYVTAGDMVRFQATGTIQMSTDANDVADAAGARSRRRATNAPLPDQPAGALIARLNQGAPMFIGGNTAWIRAPQSGRLYLSANDDFLDDNTGAFQVRVQVQRDSTR